MARFVMKHTQSIRPEKKPYVVAVNNNITISEDMGEEIIKKLNKLEAIVDDKQNNVKRIKKDKGLIERTESSKVVLTEDNKQLLVD